MSSDFAHLLCPVTAGRALYLIEILNSFISQLLDKS